MSMDAAASERAHVALERLLAAHEACFDVEHDYSFAGRDFAGMPSCIRARRNTCW